MTPLRPEISVVILCYRAERLVPVFVSEVEKALRNQNLSYELVLVGNYHAHMKNIDQTPSIVQELAQKNPRIIPVTKVKEGMMGWDMRSGLSVATGETVAVIDGDGQIPAGDIVRIYKKLKEGGYDLAKTYRDDRRDGVIRKVMSIIYNATCKLLFHRVHVRDINSKPKIFTYDALRKLELNSDDWFIDAEIILKASYLGLTIGEVPTKFFANKYRSSFIGYKAILEFIKNLLIFRYRLWF
jgi:glycosyltransferase involved in cell wall biosynthesis